MLRVTVVTPDGMAPAHVVRAQTVKDRDGGRAEVEVAMISDHLEFQHNQRLLFRFDRGRWVAEHDARIECRFARAA